MEPAQAGKSGSGGSGGNRQLKRWGPIVGIVAVVAIGVGILLATGGDDEGEVTTSNPPATEAPAATPSATDPPPTESAPPASEGTDSTDAPPETEPAPAEVTFPMSYPEAVEAGLEGEIDWGTRCDTETGRLAVPDFFAPECYAPFSGDNGGATAPGVTADEITVVWYIGQEGDPIIAYITDAVKVDESNDQIADTMNGVIEYYEAFYEMYGRSVNLVTFQGTGGASDDVAARADAARIAEEYKPFAVLGGPILTSAFADELAARDILCVGCTPGQPTEFYADRDPYVWSLAPSSAQAQAHSVEFITKQLIGKNAEHAGEAFVDTPRKFGLLYLESSAASAELAGRFADQMEEAGAPFAEVIAYELNPATIQQTASQVISQLKAAGVTTIVFSGDPVAPRDFTKEATAQEYFPEWYSSAGALVDTSAFGRTYDPDQWQHAFALTFLAARTDPTAQGARFVYEWFHGETPEAPGNLPVFQPNAAFFFATVQRIGPDLTAENFKTAVFDFAGTQQAITQPYLSWGEKGYWEGVDYHGIDDATIIWWDPDVVGPDELRKEAPGMWQFVDGGTRYLPGEWPTEERLFDPEGAVNIYLTPPPGEEPKQYPSPAGGS